MQSLKEQYNSRMKILKELKIFWQILKEILKIIIMELLKLMIFGLKFCKMICLLAQNSENVMNQFSKNLHEFKLSKLKMKASWLLNSTLLLMTISIILLLLNNLILKEIKSKRVMEMLLNGKKEKMLQLKSSRKRIKIKKLDKKLLKVNKLKNNHSSIFSTLLKLILMMKMKMNKIKILILNFYNNNTNLPLIFMIKWFHIQLNPILQLIV